MATRVLKPRLERENEAAATGAAPQGLGFVARVTVVAAVAAAALALWRASDVLLMAFGGFSSLRAARVPLHHDL